MTLFPCWTSLSLPGASDLRSGEESSRLMIVLHPKPGIGWGSPWQQILVLALEQWTSFSLYQTSERPNCFPCETPPVRTIGTKRYFLSGHGMVLLETGAFSDMTMSRLYAYGEKDGDKKSYKYPISEKLKRVECTKSVEWDWLCVWLNNLTCVTMWPCEHANYQGECEGLWIAWVRLVLYDRPILDLPGLLATPDLEIYISKSVVLHLWD